MDQINPHIADLIARGALFGINHSAGKDSQAMTIKLREIIPPDQLVLIHAELPGADWEGLIEHIEANSGGLPLHTCRAVKTFMEMVEHRGMFPSPDNRQCTSDLKRGPIEKLVRRILRERGRSLYVNCVGIRAQESRKRAKATTFEFDARNSKAGREWYSWLPIHQMSEAEVWATIHGAGQQGHRAYAAGMRRLSCRFCIMATEEDLQTAGRLDPDGARLYASTERRLDRTMLMPKKGGQRVFLDELFGFAVPTPAA
ncbi:phosphoadenosine phosphosulfate reductase [Azospirillum argentinense]|uniref:phosphoadenosine phosphosulfate reductase domain-containing protein n=1 Tax=Azospirillum argentinense TaxID=2970906 RepID=UPI0032E03618